MLNSTEGSHLFVAEVDNSLKPQQPDSNDETLQEAVFHSPFVLYFSATFTDCNVDAADWPKSKHAHGAAKQLGMSSRFLGVVSASIVRLPLSIIG